MCLVFCMEKIVGYGVCLCVFVMGEYVVGYVCVN